MFSSCSHRRLATSRFADTQYGLDLSDLERMDIVRFGWTEDSLL
jgi:hypothetical protein